MPPLSNCLGAVCPVGKTVEVTYYDTFLVSFEFKLNILKNIKMKGSLSITNTKLVPWITKWKNNASHQFHNYKNWLWREWVSHWSSFYWYKTKRIEQRNPFNCQFGIIDRQLRFCGSHAVNSILPPFLFWLGAAKDINWFWIFFWPWLRPLVKL